MLLNGNGRPNPHGRARRKQPQRSWIPTRWAKEGASAIIVVDGGISLENALVGQAPKEAREWAKMSEREPIRGFFNPKDNSPREAPKGIQKGTEKDSRELATAVANRDIELTNVRPTFGRSVLGRLHRTNAV